MGLDMYLKGKRYMSSYIEQDHPVLSVVNKAVFGDSFEFDKEERQIHINEVTAEVAYWRKANAIHSWFVTNTQKGVDECQESYVSREHMKELLVICNKILADNTLAHKLLPTRSGFFFGSTEIDDWYLADIEFTAARLNKLLTDEVWTEWEFFYQASW